MAQLPVAQLPDQQCTAMANTRGRRTQYGGDLQEVIAAVKAGEIERPKTVSNVLGVYTRS